MLSYKNQIASLDKIRYELIAQEKSEENEKKIDEHADKILALINENKDQLEFEFIFEQLTRLGHAPQLLYDDDGHWSINSEGFASVVYEGPEDWEGTFFVPKEKWFNTIREALSAYLLND